MDEQKYFEKHVRHQIFPRNDANKQIILKRIMRDFDKSERYNEDEVNHIIKKYFQDFALIRRELCNFGYLGRDPAKGVYWVEKKELSDEDFSKITRLRRHTKDVGVQK